MHHENGAAFTDLHADLITSSQACAYEEEAREEVDARSGFGYRVSQSTD
jgi:hypothetical protein